MDLQALKYIGAGLAVLTGLGSGIGEGNLCASAMDGMSRNPEMYGKLRTGMIIGCALTETTGIYGLLIAILCLVM
jgi:F-type H+-transporting ATPase subunit c